MEISAYLIGALSIALLVNQEFILGSALLLVCIAQLTMPDLNIKNTPQSIYLRFAIGTIMFVSITVFITSHLTKIIKKMCFVLECLVVICTSRQTLLTSYYPYMLAINNV